MQSRTHDGRAFRMLTVIDEFTRECLAIDVARRLTSEDVLERLSDLFSVMPESPPASDADAGADADAAAFKAALPSLRRIDACLAAKNGRLFALALQSLRIDHEPAGILINWSIARDIAEDICPASGSRKRSYPSRIN